MKGHELMIEMRRKGWTPHAICFEHGAPSGDHTAWVDATRRHRQTMLPTVWVAANETPEMLDLRFCIGAKLVILLNRGVLASRLQRLFVALQQSGAESVLLWDSGCETLWREGSIRAAATHSVEIDDFPMQVSHG